MKDRAGRGLGRGEMAAPLLPRQCSEGVLGISLLSYPSAKLCSRWQGLNSLPTAFDEVKSTSCLYEAFIHAYTLYNFDSVGTRSKTFNVVSG